MLVGYMHGVEGALEVSNWLEHDSAFLNKCLNFRRRNEGVVFSGYFFQLL